MIHESDGEIYEKHADELIRFASGLVGPSDAGDVLSSAVLRTFTSPAWSSVTNHRAYLYRAVLNEARMWRRSQGRRLQRDDRHGRPDGDAVDADGSSAGHGRTTVVRVEVRAAIAELDVRSRGVLFLSYWADLTPDEIAPLLDISASTVRRDLVRAQRKLRRTLDDRP
jgi:RNA polymerase sigma factor (sigma-70 family)